MTGKHERDRAWAAMEKKRKFEAHVKRTGPTGDFDIDKIIVENRQLRDLVKRLTDEREEKRGRPKRSEATIKKLAEAVAYARFNKGHGNSKTRSEAAIKLAAHHYGFSVRAIERAFYGKDEDVNEIGGRFH